MHRPVNSDRKVPRKGRDGPRDFVQRDPPTRKATPIPIGPGWEGPLTPSSQALNPAFTGPPQAMRQQRGAVSPAPASLTMSLSHEGFSRTSSAQLHAAGVLASPLPPGDPPPTPLPSIPSTTTRKLGRIGWGSLPSPHQH